jgi:hypothetical protein
MAIYSDDIFLGWARGRHGRDFFVRQLRDMKSSPPIERADAVQLKRFAAICGEILAHADAKSGDASTISGYLDKSDSFDRTQV